MTVLPYLLLTHLTRTEACFRFLLATLSPDLILDIGSRDGSDSLLFKTVSPKAIVMAIEANPRLYEEMTRNNSLTEKNILVQNFAITNFDGEAKFSIFQEARGTGSLLKRNGTFGRSTFVIPTKRIDSILNIQQFKKIALWIDIEGSSYEAIEGATSVLDSIQMIHAEVEAKPLWQNQKLWSDIDKFLVKAGFVAIGGGICHNKSQANVLYLRNDIASQFCVFLSIIRFTLYNVGGTLARKIGINRFLPNLFDSAKLRLKRILLPSNPNDLQGL